MAESTNVGSVSLGVEIDADFTGQLNKLADKITSQLSGAFKKVASGNSLGSNVAKDLEKSISTLSESVKHQMDLVGVNLEQSMSRVDTMLDKTLNTVNTTLKTMVDGIESAIDKILDKLKSIEATAQNTTSKIPNVSAGNISIPIPRGPPIKATKEDLLAQKSMLNDESNQIEDRVSSLRTKLKDMSAEYTKAVKLMGETPAMNKKAAEIEKLKLTIQKLENQLGKIGYKSEILDRQILKLEQDGAVAANKQVASNNKVAFSVDKLRSKISNFGSTLKTVNNSPLSKPFKGFAKITALPFKGVINGFKKMGKSAFDAGQLGSKGMNVLDKSFWKVFKKVLILGVMTKALKGFIGYIGGALMANENFRNSLATTKLNLAAAFQPIMDIIIPALINLMAVLAKVTGYMAAFVATMFGTTYKASVEGARRLKEQTDAYKELGKSSKGAAAKVDKAAKKMKGSLAGFDEINTLTVKDESDSSNEGVNGWQNAAITEIGDTSHFDKFKKILEGIFKPFQESWKNEGANTVNAVKYAFNEIIGLAKSVGKSLYDVWTNGTGTALLDSLQRNLQNILLLLGDVAKSFRLAWDDGGRGTQVIQNIGNGLVNISTLFESVGVSLRTMWANVGNDIAVNCLDIFNNVTQLFSRIPKTFKESWDKNKIGTEFLNHLGEAFNVILGLVKNITGSLDGLWSKFGPSIADTVMQCLNATSGMFESMTNGFKSIWDNGGNYLFESIGRLATRIFELAGRLYSEFIAPLAGWLAETLGPPLGKVLEFVGKILDKFSELIEWLLKDGNPTLEALVIIIGSIATALGAYNLALKAISLGLKAYAAVQAIATAAAGAFGTIMAVITSPITLVIAAIAAVIAIGVLLYKHWDEIGPRLAKIWENVKKFFANIAAKAVEFCKNFIKGLLEFLGNLLNYIGSGIGKILITIGNFLGKFLQSGIDLLSSLAKGIWQGMGNAVSAMADVGRCLINALSNISLYDIGRNLLIGLWNGISSVTDWIFDKLGGFCDNIVDVVCSWFGIHSPSRVFRDQIGKMIPRGMAIGIEAESDKVMKAMDSLMVLPTLSQPDISMTSDIKPSNPGDDKDEIIREIIELFGRDNVDSSDDIPVIIQLDGEVIAKSTIKNINRMSKRNGKPVIVV